MPTAALSWPRRDEGGRSIGTCFGRSRRWREQGKALGARVEPYLGLGTRPAIHRTVTRPKCVSPGAHSHATATPMERPLKRIRTSLPEAPEDAIDLQVERERNDLNLKGAFEDIIKKYSKDFTDVGDEIDLETGEIIINNGHLSRMRDERDTGTTNVGRFLNSMRSLVEDTEDEEEEEDEESPVEDEGFETISDDEVCMVV